MKRLYHFSLLLTAVILACLPLPSIAQPRIGLDQDAIGLEDPEGPVELDVTVFNRGDARLFWHAELVINDEPRHIIPMRDDPGELIGTFNARDFGPNEHLSPSAWDWDNEWIWVLNPEQGFASAFDAGNDYQEARRINTGECYDGAWIAGILYLPQANSHQLMRFNAQGQNIGNIQMPFPVLGIAADIFRQWLFVMNAQDTAIYVFDIQDNGGLGERLGVIDNHLEYHNNTVAFSLEWVPKHLDGQLWMLDYNTGRIHQIDVDTDEWQCTEDVQSFIAFPGANESLYSTVAHDMYNFYAGGFDDDRVRIYDDGITENYWIWIDRNGGNIDPGEDGILMVSINPTDLVGGNYSAVILFDSNDPVQNSPVADVELPVDLRITGVPDIAVEWPEVAGFPDTIDFNAFFDNDIFNGFAREIELTIRNVGSDALNVAEIFCDNAAFTIETENFVLDPRESLENTIRFFADEDGLYESVLTIVSNDPVQEQIDIPIRAEAILPPTISIDPDSIRQVLDWREAAEQIITLANNGESDLRWLAEIEPVPIRDESNEVLITIDPATGVVEAGADIDLVLFMEFIESDSLPELFYVRFTSNDPENPEVAIPITIQTLDIGDSGRAPLPTATKLLSVYPNPFNNSTTISFAVRAQGLAPIRLAVYGIDGRMVGDLVTGRDAYPPGYYSVIWNAEGVPAGSYLVRLEADGRAVEEQWVRLVK